MDASARGRDATLPMTGSVRFARGWWAGRRRREVGGGRDDDCLRCILRRQAEHRQARYDRRSRRGWRWRDTNGNVIYHIIEKKKGRGRTGPEGRCKPVRRRRTRHVVLFLSHPSFLAWSFFTGAGRTAKVVLLLCHHANSSENRNPKRGNGQGRSSVGVPLGVSALPVPRSSPVPVSPLLVGCCGWCRGLVPCCPDSDGLTHAVQQSASLFPDPSPRSCPVADWEGVHLT
jgi:hypothetical protein